VARVRAERAAAWRREADASPARIRSAYDIVMPSGGLVQLFAAESGGELARYVPASELPRLELRSEIPLPPDWEDDEESRETFRTSLLVDLYPDAMVPGTGDLPGYSFGWWPFSDYGLREVKSSWPGAPDPALWTFLAVCDSHDELGLRFSDMGYLWAVIPTAELATGDFTHLLCDGESS
jgi:hypothetical protein